MHRQNSHQSFENITRRLDNSENIFRVAALIMQRWSTTNASIQLEQSMKGIFCFVQILSWENEPCILLLQDADFYFYLSLQRWDIFGFLHLNSWHRAAKNGYTMVSILSIWMINTQLIHINVKQYLQWLRRANNLEILLQQRRNEVE